MFTSGPVRRALWLESPALLNRYRKYNDTFFIQNIINIYEVLLFFGQNLKHFNIGSDFKMKNGDNVTLCLIGNLKIRRQSL